MRMKKVDNRERNSNNLGDRKSPGFSNDCIFGLGCEESGMILKFLLSYPAIPLLSRE